MNHTSNIKISKHRKPNNYWTKERCHQESLKYISRREFEINSRAAYSKSTKRGWIYEICSHMIKNN